MRRCAPTAVPFGLATAVYMSVFLLSYDRLPERIAIHFSGDGGADGFTSRVAALWTGTGLLAGLGLLFTVLTLVSKEGPGARLTAAVGAGTAATLGYPLVLTVLANTDVEDPSAVHLPMWHMAVLLLAGVVTGGLTWWLTSGAPRRERARPTPVLVLAEGEAAAWSRTVTSRAMLFPAVFVVLGGLLAVTLGSWQAGLLPLALGFLCAPFVAVRVTVDRRGLTVASTVVPRPRLTVPLATIVSSDSVQVDAMGDFGGWGYRVRPNRRGVVLRSGEALSVRTAGGRAYVVTVDDSTTAAGLLNGLARRRATGV